MPSFHNVWLVSSPRDSNSDDEQLSDLAAKLQPGTQVPLASNTTLPMTKNTDGQNRTLPALGSIKTPDFKTGTLSSLLNVSEALAKHDTTFTGILSKIVDTIRSLDPNELQKNLVLDDGRPFESYILDGWEWNRAKFRTEGRPLDDLVDSFSKDMSALDSIHKQKLGNYNLAKGQLTALVRKQTGNLATRDLSAVINKSDVPEAIKTSEYMDVVYVAVPKNNAKDWEAKYERLTQMVVPRSSTKIAADDEYILYTAVVFKRVKEEFVQRCREEKFTVREFQYDEAAVLKQQREMEELKHSERDLWAELLRVSRINYSEGLELLVHLKVIRGFVESVLRYGLPASYFSAFIKPDPKNSKKLVNNLNSYFAPLVPASQSSTGKKGNSSGGDDLLVGEYASVMEAEVFPFVLFEISDPESLEGR